MVLGNITPCRPLSTMITQKVIYTYRWLRSHMDVDGLNSDGGLPHWQLCWSHYRWRVRLQDWLHTGDELVFKVNYISEDLLPVMVTSHYFLRGPHPKFFAHLWIKAALANSGHLAIYPTLPSVTKIITLNANSKKTVTLNTL